MLIFRNFPSGRSSDNTGILMIPAELDLSDLPDEDGGEDEFVALLMEYMSKPIRNKEEKEPVSNRFASWSVAELYWKMDSEGGIAELIRWGGAEVFTALGDEAVEAAYEIEQAMEVINGLFDQHQEEIDSALEEEW